ncbi:hypothetical protein SFUMM280S_09969 [Streptomyces fumanus]
MPGPEDACRIVYGPEYTRRDLARLHKRFLNHKRSLALREYALGLEALDRLADGEPLWRLAVFGVLALESEPVDPRLCAGPTRPVSRSTPAVSRARRSSAKPRARGHPPPGTGDA